MQALAIVVLSILVAVGYGVVHDQITARACLEYFTIGHPQIFAVPIESPTVIGFVWGVLASWWVGLGLGLLLAIAARAGTRPKLPAASFIRPLLVLVLAAGLLALIAGIVGYLAAERAWVTLPPRLAERVPRQLHTRFIADLFAHNMSYLAGAIGGIVIIVRAWRSRSAPPIAPVMP